MNNFGKKTVRFASGELDEANGCGALLAYSVFAQEWLVQRSLLPGSNCLLKRYPPEYTEVRDLVLPKNSTSRRWVFVGSPLTPNALNDGSEFSGIPYVYMDLARTQIYQATVNFGGDDIPQELNWTCRQKSRRISPEPSGRGLFSREDSLSRCDGQRYQALRLTQVDGVTINFNHFELKARRRKCRPKSECGLLSHWPASKTDG